ncbi:MAG: sigma-70 family RNA polymerase sigma factor [Planctomycetota bacterium]
MSEENLPRPIQSYVRRIARSVARGDGDLADDLEQATFLVALQSGPGKRELLRPWLYSVCANTLRGLLRRDRTDRDAAQVDPFANEGEPLDIVLDDELRSVVRGALRRLPSLQREALELRFLEELPADEVARRLGVPVETARSRTKRGLTSLRTVLESYRGEEQRRAGWLALPSVLTLHRRSVAAALACALAAAVGVAVILGERDAENATAGSTAHTSRVASVDLAETEADRRRTRVHRSATVHVRPTDALVSRWPAGPVVELVHGEAEPRVVAVAPRGTTTVAGLATGRTVARVNGVVIGERVLLDGEQEWDLAWGTAASLEVTVLDGNGHPAAGVELFEADPPTWTPRGIATTGEDGRASVEVASLDSWIAARGAPGSMSRAVPVGQSSVQSDGVLQLQLEDRPISWVQIETAEDKEGTNDRFGHRLYHEGQACRVEGSSGVSSAATWIPPWRDAADRLGFIRRRVAWRLVLQDAGGAFLWTSPPIEAGEAAPGRVVLPPVQRFEGRLVDAHGSALVGVDLTLGVRMDPGVRLDQARTDSRGLFALSARIEPERALLKVFDRPVARVGEPDVNGWIGDVVPKGAGLKCVDLRVAGTTDDVGVHVITDARAKISHAHHLGGAVGRVADFRIGPGTPFRLWGPQHAIAGVVVIGNVDGERTVRIVRDPLTVGEAVPDVVDLRAEQSATLEGSLDPALLPAIGFARELGVGHTEFLAIDPSTGRFSLAGLPDGLWTVQLMDRDGRVHTCSEPVALAPGAAHDLGRIDVERGRLRVLLPPTANGTDLRISYYWRSRWTLARRVTESEFLRGIVDLDLPEGSHCIAVRESPQRKWFARTTILPRQRSECRPSDDFTRLVIKDFGRSIDDVSRSSIEVFREGDQLVATISGEELATEHSGRVAILCPRGSRFRVVQTADTRVRSADTPAECDSPTFHVALPWRWGFHRDADRSVSPR